MQLKWFRIPVGGCPEMEEELNAFLRGHRVLSVTRELVERDSAPGWAVCVEYQEGTVAGEARRGGSGRAAKKIDYREVLSEADFAVFSKLRELRKAIADKEAIPAYSVFTNEQLAAMVTGKVDSLTALSAIAGIGAARIEKYGQAFLAALAITKEAGK